MLSLLRRHPIISRVNKYIFPSVRPRVLQAEHPQRALSLVCRPAALSDWPSICEVCVPAFEGLDYIPSQFPTFLSVQQHIRRCFVFIDRSYNKLVCLDRLFWSYHFRSDRNVYEYWYQFISWKLGKKLINILHFKKLFSIWRNSSVKIKWINFSWKIENIIL